MSEHSTLVCEDPTRAKQRLTIRMPDDWHVHLRDGAIMRAIVPLVARQFGRAIVMPNLVPPIRTIAEAIAYRDRIITARLLYSQFMPLMTCYLTEDSSPDEIIAGYDGGVWHAVKLYTAHGTTNAASGVVDLKKCYPVFEAMQKARMPLLIHGELQHYSSNGREVDPFDKEHHYIDLVLRQLRKDFPELPIVLEHITTSYAVQYIREQASEFLGATITAHHLMRNRGHLLSARDGLQPHLWCLPVLKRVEDQLALRSAATSGERGFFLGTDSAPHPTKRKEHACGCAAGVFTSHAAIELYAQVFHEEGKLHNLEAFASINGPRFYRLPIHERTIQLVRDPWTIDSIVRTKTRTPIRPFLYHEDLAKRQKIEWRLVA